MKNAMMKISGRILASLLMLAMLCQVASALEIAGVKVEQTATIKNEALVLNGAGIRKKLFIKVYVGALYLTAKHTSVNDILAAPGPKRIAMHFLYKEVSREKLVDGWNEGFEGNNSAEEIKQLQDRINRFNSFFITVKKGDVIRLDYVPGEGTQVWINDSPKGAVEGEDFYRALLKIWIGNKPADDGLKKAWLGG